MGSTSANTVLVPNSSIRFKIKDSADVSFTVPLQISVSKSNKRNRWYVFIDVLNPTDLTVQVNLTLYVNKSNPPHTINNTTVLFNKTLTLKPNEDWSWNNTKNPLIHNGSVAFFLKYSIVNGKLLIVMVHLKGLTSKPCKCLT
jgi:hypothetical protein